MIMLIKKREAFEKTYAMIKKSARQKIAKSILCTANRIGFPDAYSRVKGFFSPQVVILMYHRVGPCKEVWSLPGIEISDFESQIRYINETHKILPLDELAQRIREKRPLPPRSASITIDDGFKDARVYAYPILKKYKAAATIFLITGHIGSGELFWCDKVRYLLWNTKLKRIELDGLGSIPLNHAGDRLQSSFKIGEHLKKITEGERIAMIEKLVNVLDVDIPSDLGKELFLTWDEVKEMSDNGISFGAHTVTHPILTRVSSKQARYEITQSKREIERRLGQPVTTFSYPNGSVGDFDSKIIHMLKESGFKCAVTTIQRQNTLKTGLYELGRISPSCDFDSFKFDIYGLHPNLRNIVSR